ncbi:MAG TPA: glycoside hydrolase family 88 protein, partial [Cellvibrionaceae bacterium]
MNISRCILAFTGVLLLSACATTGSLTDEQHEVKQIADQVAHWQLAHMDNFDYVRTFRDHTAQPDGWVQAAFYIGLTRWYQTTENSTYQQALITKALANNWANGPLYWHADDQAIAQMYLALADETELADISKVQADFERILAAQPQNSLEFIPDPDGKTEGTCQWRWCWSDALFMAPPAWAALSRITGDERYLDYALKEFAATTDYLFDKEDFLYYRDSRFFDRRTEHGNKVFWSRGNGWVFAGLPLLLEQMPADHPERAMLLELYQQMASTFK